MLCVLNSRFIRRFGFFVVYFMIFVLAFLFRPGNDTVKVTVAENVTDANGTIYTRNKTIRDPCYLLRVRTHYDIVSHLPSKINIPH